MSIYFVLLYCFVHKARQAGKKTTLFSGHNNKPLGMKCAEVSEEARVEQEDAMDDQMLGTCELEAAESLAGLARCSPQWKALPSNQTESVVTSSSRHHQDQAIAAQQLCEYTSIPSPMKTKKTFKTRPSRLCSTSYQSNSSSKLRQHLTEAEKEEQRLRRVLANRESARQTIRRRQDMYLELTRKAADLSEENDNLKKEKELAVNVHTSLKVRNEILKTQIAKIKKAEPGGMQGEPKSSQSNISSSASTSKPIFSCNQPSLVPVFLHSIAPSSDAIQYQCASRFDEMSSLHLPMSDLPCSHQGQENSNGIPRLGTPLFVFPVPWLLPFLAQSGIFHSHSGTDNSQSKTSSTHQCSMCFSSYTPLPGDNRQLSSPQNVRMESTYSVRPTSAGSVQGAGFSFPHCGQYTGCNQSKDTVIVSGTLSSVRPVESLEHTRNSQNFDANAIAASKHITHWMPKNNQEPIICPHKKSEDAFAATEARRRRKELRKLKSIHNHHSSTHY